MITFPELDQWGTPTQKLPDCPQCGEDELGVIHFGLMMCYACGWQLERQRSKVAGPPPKPSPPGTHIIARGQPPSLPPIVALAQDEGDRGKAIGRVVAAILASGRRLRGMLAGIWRGVK